MADTEVDEQLYKGFDLTEFDQPERAQAIIDFLELDGEKDSITENGDEYSINARKVKEGDSPQKYVDVITDFKTLLTPKQRDKINSYLKLLNELGTCECGKVKDKLYKHISKSIESKVDSDAYRNCERHSIHVVNILYHLLWLPTEREPDEPDYVTSYREAWFGRVPKDTRKYYTRDDGEYLVLTDAEADERASDCLDEYQWAEAVKARQTTLGFDDWVEWVLSMDGRGPQIASYDSCESDQEVDGTTYYIYKTG